MAGQISGGDLGQDYIGGNSGGAAHSPPYRVDPPLARPTAVSNLGEVLRRDRLPGQGATASRPWGMAYIAPSALAAAASMTVSQIG